MKAQAIRRASTIALAVSAALGSAAAWSQAAGPTPQPQGGESAGEEMGVITVTGSRTITEVVKSPTPITSVDIAEITATTPSDTADALNKLPTILGGRTPRTQGNGSTNNGGNTLSLRNFGSERTLVLINGHRVAPANQNGSVNIDVMPQMLVKRVDIVTGGASAIYGSDAVAGVVNYVLDTDFTGFNVKGDYGMSKYSDGDQYQVGVAWGTNLFSDRGHFEISGRYRHQDMIPIADRPYGKDGQAWLLTGNGTTGNPFKNTPYSRVFNSGPDAGNIICGQQATCLYNNYTVDGAGNLVPLVHGTATGSPPVESGGGGAYIKYGTFRSELEMKDVFTRFDVDLGEKTNWYIQGSWAQAENASNWIQWVVSPSAGRPNSIFVTNPYIPGPTQQALGSTVDCATVPAGARLCLPLNPATSPQTGSTPPPPIAPGETNRPFIRVPSYTFNTVDGFPADQDPIRLYRTLGDQKQWNAETGVTGSFGEWSWDVYYNHSVSDLTVTNPNNTSNAKYLAALDAVNDNGTIKCWVSTQPQFANLYPGCVPINVFTPGGVTAAAYDYLRQKTSWNLIQKLDDVGVSIGGPIGFGLPAGDIVANVSAEGRWQTYNMQSDFLPSDFVNCTGLRFCLANGAAPLLWVQNTVGEVDQKDHVYEFALEFNIPLAKDIPALQDVSLNLAGRRAKYENFDSGDSWKIGLNWQIVDAVRFRGTLSSDFRAPNMNNLYEPVGVTSTGFTDRLTGVSNQGQRLFTGGNPLLTPETAKTVTAGLVFTPSFIDRFSFAVDYYQTRLENAITQISYQSDTIQGLCLASAPKYDSPFCTLAIRPITDPSDPNYTQPVNAPVAIRNAPANSALIKTRGFDFQVDYSVDLWGGQFSFRHLANYQPTNSTLNTPASTFYTWAVQPHLMQTTFLNWSNEGWNVALVNRWLSNVNLKTSDNSINPANNQHYVDSSLDANDVVDITLGKNFEFGDSKVEAYLTVSNLLDERAPLYGSNSGLPGLFYPTLGFYDDMGRFFTLGFRTKF